MVFSPFAVDVDQLYLQFVDDTLKIDDSKESRGNSSTSNKR